MESATSDSEQEQEQDEQPEPEPEPEDAKDAALLKTILLEPWLTRHSELIFLQGHGRSGRSMQPRAPLRAVAFLGSRS